MIDLHLTIAAKYTLTDDMEKALYACGVPYQYLNARLDHLDFAQYRRRLHYRSEYKPATETVESAQSQVLALKDICDAIAPLTNEGAVALVAQRLLFWGLCTDHRAMEAAVVVARAALNTHRSVICVSLDEILADVNAIHRADVYMIHGISNSTSAAHMTSLRSFTRRRSGSMHLIVASAPDDKVQELVTTFGGIAPSAVFVLAALDKLEILV